MQIANSESRKRLFASLKFRSVFASIIMILIIYSLYFYYFINFYHQQRNEMLNNRAVLITSIQALSLVQPIWNMDDYAINLHLKSLRQDDDYCGSIVKAVNGSEIAKDEIEKDNSDHINITKNIMLDNGHAQEYLGDITICFSKKRLNEELRTQLENTIAMVALLICILSGSVYFSINLIASPLSKIRKIFESIDFKSLSKIEDKELLSDNEIGVLSKAFNRMIGEIYKSSHKMEEALVKAREANLDKTEFLQNMSYELRTLIHGINSFIGFGIQDVINEKVTRQELYSYFASIKEFAGKLNTLVGNILDITQLEVNQDNLRFEEVDLIAISKKSLLEFQDIINKKNIDIKFTHSIDLDAICWADKGKIQQIYENILTNAIFHSYDNSQIIIETMKSIIKIENKDVDAFKVTIIDQGTGIPEDSLESIFEKFVQIGQKNGNGLGLTICRNIISAHNGKIWAENNKDGVGCRFIFILPINLPINH
jgi:signal transduction histidine kinase